MLITNNFKEASKLTQPTAVAIGNFDGVHIGHKKILSLLVEHAHTNKLNSVALTFFPHPGKITGKGQIKLLQTLPQKLEKMGSFELDMVFVLPFDKKIAELSSREFIQRVLLNTLHTQTVVVGQNFRFGKDRSGDVFTLKSLAQEFNFSIESVPSVRKGGYAVSSSTIRDLLLKGKIESANDLLGSAYEITGTVVKGKARGKGLGFPTANIKTPNEIIPSGVSITAIQINGKGSWFPSVTNVGTSPTFKQEQRRIETHIMDHKKELYGQNVLIRFLKKIRDEIEFPSPEALASQIDRDITTAKHFFARSS